MSPVGRHRLAGLALAGLVWLADQLVKRAMIGPLHLPEVGVIDLLPFFDLRFTPNYGVSLGMIPAQSPEMRWLLVALSAAAGMAWLAFAG